MLMHAWHRDWLVVAGVKRHVAKRTFGGLDELAEELAFRWKRAERHVGWRICEWFGSKCLKRIRNIYASSPIVHKIMFSWGAGLLIQFWRKGKKGGSTQTMQ